MNFDMRPVALERLSLKVAWGGGGEEAIKPETHLITVKITWPDMSGLRSDMFRLGRICPVCGPDMSSH
jgi:hypothetical protein